MNILKRIEILERNRSEEHEDCNRIIAIDCSISKPEPPTEEQITKWLNDTGLCKGCNGGCGLVWDGSTFRTLNLNRPGEGNNFTVLPGHEYPVRK